MRRHEGAKVKLFDVSNVFYHKFSHGAVSYTLNVENIKVMLEFSIQMVLSTIHLLLPLHRQNTYLSLKFTDLAFLNTELSHFFLNISKGVNSASGAI